MVEKVVFTFQENAERVEKGAFGLCVELEENLICRLKNLGIILVSQTGILRKFKI